MKLFPLYIFTLLVSLSSLHLHAQNNDDAKSDTLAFIIDTTESYVAWNCDSHNGIVPLKEGVVKIVSGHIVSGSFKMKMDSIKDLDIDYVLMRKTLENTLRSEFFFDTKNFPTTNFEIDYAEQKKKNIWLIAGDLWIRGMVSCVQFNSTINFDQRHFSAVSDTFKIDRTIWGLTIYSKEEATSDDSIIVSNEIGFVIHLTGLARDVR